MKHTLLNFFFTGYRSRGHVMGASVSSNVNISKQELVNNTIASAIMKTAQACNSDQTVTQHVETVVRGSDIGSITLDATATADISCIQTAVQTAELSTNIANQLKALIEQEATAGPALFSIGVSTNVSDTEQKIVNTISSSIDISSIQQAVARQSVGQDVKFDISDSRVKQILVNAGASSVVAAVQNNTASATARADLANAIEATSSQKATSGWSIVALIALFVMMCCGSCIYAFTKKSGGGPPGGASASGDPNGLSKFLGGPDAANILSDPAAVGALAAL